LNDLKTQSFLSSYWKFTLSEKQIFLKNFFYAQLRNISILIRPEHDFHIPNCGKSRKFSWRFFLNAQLQNVSIFIFPLMKILLNRSLLKLEKNNNLKSALIQAYRYRPFQKTSFIRNRFFTILSHLAFLCHQMRKMEFEEWHQIFYWRMGNKPWRRARWRWKWQIHKYIFLYLRILRIFSNFGRETIVEKFLKKISWIANAILMN